MGEYQVILVFRFDTDNETFCYNEYTDMDEAEFVEFMEQCRQRQLYDTGISVSYGDELLTLSTCEYTYKNGRFVVVAKRIMD
jgi:sortase B